MSSRLSYANVMATAAMFVALGGGAYALSGVPDGAGVFHGCVSNATGLLRVVKKASACHRPRGKGKHRDRGEFAVSWNQKGSPGQPGSNGAPFDANATLPPGQTLVGTWTVGAGNNDTLATQLQFTPKLPADLPAGSVQRAFTSGPPTAQCPGVGRAAPGFFCLYETASNATFSGIFNGFTGGSGASQHGVLVDYNGTSADAAAYGTWAVTAP